MKRMMLMVVVAIMTTLTVNAQNEDLKNEIGVAYGFGSNTDLIGSFYKGIFTGKQLSYWGPVSVEYFRRVTSNNRLGVGAVFAVGGCKWDEDNANKKSTFYTFMPAVKYNWVNKNHFGLYSKFAAGFTIGSDSGRASDTNGKDNKTSTSFNFQVTGIGVEAGGAVRGFAELGFGEQGVALVGVRFKF